MSYRILAYSVDVGIILIDAAESHPVLPDTK
jgi:hypothetical protein